MVAWAGSDASSFYVACCCNFRSSCWSVAFVAAQSAAAAVMPDLNGCWGSHQGERGVNNASSATLEKFQRHFGELRDYALDSEGQLLAVHDYDYAYDSGKVCGKMCVHPLPQSSSSRYKVDGL